MVLFLLYVQHLRMVFDSFRLSLHYCTRDCVLEYLQTIKQTKKIVKIKQPPVYWLTIWNNWQIAFDHDIELYLGWRVHNLSTYNNTFKMRPLNEYRWVGISIANVCCQVNCQLGFWYMVKLISSDSSVECLCYGVLIIIADDIWTCFRWR